MKNRNNSSFLNFSRIKFHHHQLLMFAFLLMGLQLLPLLARESTPKYSEVRIYTPNPADITALQEKGMEFDHVKKQENGFDVVLSSKDMEILKSTGLSYKILVADLTADFQQRSALSESEWKSLEREMKNTYSIEGFEFGSMGGFYTFAEVVTELDSMRLLYPNLITAKQSLGQSIEGREIWMVKISDNPDVNEQEPEVLYTALHHAREPESIMAVIYYMYYLLENYGTDPEVTFLVNNRELYFVPVINPDGYVYNQQTNPNGGGMWRKNRRNNGGGTYGVDLNRNYGYKWGYDNNGSSPNPSSETYRGTAPFSEPETQAIRDLCNAHNFKLTLNYHTYGDLLIYPWGYNDNLTPDSLLYIALASDMTQFNGYTYGTGSQTVGYIVNGDSDDWMYGEQTTKGKIMAMTPEVGSSFWPSPSQIYPLAQENIYPNLVLAHGPGVILADPLDPNPPENFNAYSDYQTPNSVQLNWTDPTSYTNGDPLTNFTIEIFRDNSFVASVASSVEIFTDTGLNDGQLYSYEIFTKDVNDSMSTGTGASVYAGGAPEPNPPVNFFIIDPGGGLLTANWTNPATNIDGTPMDDLAKINLYEDSILLSNFTMSPGDTGQAVSRDFTPTGGTHQYYVTAVDNETPPNESAPSNSGYSPLAIPFFDTFISPPTPNPGFWINTTAEVTSQSVNPPSPAYALMLDGHPSGGDRVALLPVDLSGAAGQGMIFSYWYQPAGTGNDPEPGDSLIIEFKNDSGTWKSIRSYPGTSVVPFVNEIISIDAEDPGPGATFFHPTFQVRFRNIGTSSSSSHYDLWFVDDVFLGFPTNNPRMIVAPLILSDTLLVGATAVLHFNISNTQPAPSSLNFTVSENPTVDWLNVSPQSGTVTSSHTLVLDVNIDAGSVSAGLHTTQLVVTGNDSSNTADTVDVAILVNNAPMIAISPDSIHFALLVNGSDSQTVTINNTGGGPLEVLSIEDEEINNESRKPSWVQPQKPSLKESKGENGTFRGDVTDGSGGPDPFGYKWIDSDEANGPAYQFTDISAGGTVVNLLPTGTFDPKDEGMATLSMPWDIKFYGNTYNQIQVNSNGAIVLDMNYFANMFSNVGIPNSADPNLYLAPFWDDLDGRAGGEIYYETIGNRFIIQWDHWGHYPSGTENLTFQTVFFKNSSTVMFVYENMAQAQTDATVGIENADGTIGLQISYDQAYVHNQLLTKISKGADWLNETPQSGTIPPGGSMDINITANAAGLAVGDYAANLIVSSNDPLNPIVKLPRVSLTVAQNMPIINVSTDSVLFDTTNIGTTASLPVTVWNSGNIALQVTNIISTDTVFTATPTTLSIPPADSQVVNVHFSPPSIGYFSGLIRFASNDPGHDTLDIFVAGQGDLLSGIAENPEIPTTFAVAQNFPNPFNPTTTIKYQLPNSGHVRLTIYNLLGQKVRTLVNTRQDAGYYQAVWDGRNDQGNQVSSGIYIYRFEGEGFIRTLKMILMK